MKTFCLSVAALAAVATPVAAERAGVVSPDGLWKATVRPVAGTRGAAGETATALWITDARTGRSRELFRGRPSRDQKQNRVSLANPDFSLDGGYVYVEADAYATSPAVHQVSVRTGAARYVTDGALAGVVRTGPWRGFLLVQQHRYRRDGNGSFDPHVVVRPDGREMAVVPGSDGSDPDAALARWLRGKGWRLS